MLLKEGDSSNFCSVSGVVINAQVKGIVVNTQAKNRLVIIS